MILSSVLVGMIGGLLIGSVLGVRFSIYFVLDHALAAALAAGADRREYLMQLSFSVGKLDWARRVARDASPSKCDTCGWMREPKLEYEKRLSRRG